ncbi:SDR family NAD(P)-dependent oxidoreductase [Paracoccus aminophilus]|uniref:3-hydroxyacyl-CoA dehydrogenase n=1 Tax=Paracoccus aminophilus JCM 7686 TaxID=1367847 RepID=S5XKP0_PARAH|nr:SDR family NAD(P)-dependent oxidoreductase [Paracoccus aminophilus]AGT07784.1 3-hydroxyacyl-CoA dehydrogenase [Paracoccus aminophilus JCM 7686]
MRLSETCAIVTGGASGLGAATAEYLRKSGARVAILDRDARGADFAEIIGAAFFETDVTQEDSTLAAMRGARAAMGQINVCINCAGIMTAAKTVSQGAAHDLAVFRRTIEVNLVGTFNTLRLAAAEMAANRPNRDTGERGVIVNTASVAAYEGQKGQVAYAASKAAVAGMTLPLARDLSAQNIRVCAIAPGVFGTPTMRGLPGSVQQDLTADIPYPRRMGEPVEFARLVGTIIETAYLNGEVIRLDGALRMG